MRVFLLGMVAISSTLENARDRQDRVALLKAASELAAAAEKNPHNAENLYRAALAHSYLAEVALEVRDKAQARKSAEAGIGLAERALRLQPQTAEYHRLLGTLCGQVIPANVLAGLGYGKRAREAVGRAIELDPKSSPAYLARGVGNYYLPAPLGGGLEAAVRDFNRAIELDPKSAEAYLWLGLALRKLNRNAEARKALEKSLNLNPNRIWTRQQLEKTPAR